MISDFTRKKIFAPGNGGGKGGSRTMCQIYSKLTIKTTE